jgi:hypothetical protein
MVKILLAICAALLSVAGFAQDPEPKGKAAVVVALDGDDLVVTITLDRAVDQLRFEQADVIRADAVKVVTPGLTFTDDVITGAAPFRQLQLRVVEDLTERDAKYPPFYRIAQGRLLYAPTVYPSEEAWEVTLAIAHLPENWLRWPDEPLPMGFLFMGPRSMVAADASASFVFDGKGDAAFEVELRKSVGDALSFLIETFGSVPTNRPFVATSLLPAERSFSTGDVTENSMVALRFFGQAPDPAAPDALATTRSIILHEGAHFWNGGVAHFAKGTPQWLHEGGAEYIAKLGSLRLGWTDREALQSTIANWLSQCRTSLTWLEEAALNDLTFLPASVRYSCGPLLHTLFELYLVDSGSDRMVVDGWRETVREAAATEAREYDLADFYAALGDPKIAERPALAAILATSGPGRWSLVESELGRMGVSVTQISDAPLRARTALIHMINAQCTGLKPGDGYGFYSGATSYRLQTPEGCGLLTGDPDVATLAGRPVSSLSVEDYAALQTICAAQGTVAFGLTDGSAIDVPCETDLGPADTRPVITTLPDIPAFR